MPFLLSARTAIWFMPVVLTEWEKENDWQNQWELILQNQFVMTSWRSNVAKVVGIGVRASCKSPADSFNIWLTLYFHHVIIFPIWDGYTVQIVVWYLVPCMICLDSGITLNIGLQFLASGLFVKSMHFSYAFHALFMKSTSKATKTADSTQDLSFWPGLS